MSTPNQTPAPAQAGHTPGPWMVQVMPDNEVCVRTDESGPRMVIADVVNLDMGNARLIAAAPALLAALTRCVEALEVRTSNGPTPVALKMARAAIALAGGDL